MSALSTERLNATPEGVARAAEHLRGGRLVAFPTETVYGLGADATAPAAVAAIYAAKGRPAFNPLIVHVADLDAARVIGTFGPDALALARAFWPGPLTLVVPLGPGAGIAPAVLAGHDTIALRSPAHPLARALLTAAGLPLAAPSANRSGHISPTTADHVGQELDGRIHAILDGGACTVGLESTIVDVTGPPRLLRPGGLPAAMVEACLGRPLAEGHDNPDAPTAPGQLASHYAPEAALRLNATAARPGEALLGFGGVSGAALNLSPSGDLAEAAANLFAYLRRLDTGPAAAIAVSPVPETGLGAAINDRLRRAAAPGGPGSGRA